MLFAFTEDQKAIAQAARDMLLETCTPADMRRLLAESRTIDTARWSAICEMGLLAMLAPPARGGLGMSLVDFIPVAEAAGYAGLPEPLAGIAGIVVPLLARLDDDKGWLAKVLAGSMVAIGHPANPFVANADCADALILADGEDIHIVERSDVALTAEPSFDPFRALFRVDWTPRPETRVGCGWNDSAERGAVLAAAQMIGLAQRCNDLAVAYARDRFQFGKPIGSTQAVKHLAASVQVKIEFARPVVHAAAAELPLDGLAARARAAHAKIAAGAAADLAARSAVQIFGAMGMTWEVDLHFFLKRSLALNYAWGTPAQHRATVIERIGSLPTGPDTTFASELAA